MNCPECGGELTRSPGLDGNCYTRQYVCRNGHSTTVAKVQTCPTPGCDWRGATSCFCCRYFLDEWPGPPETPQDLADRERMLRQLLGRP